MRAPPPWTPPKMARRTITARTPKPYLAEGAARDVNVLAAGVVAAAPPLVAGLVVGVLRAQRASGDRRAARLRGVAATCARPTAQPHHARGTHFARASIGHGQKHALGSVAACRRAVDGVAIAVAEGGVLAPAQCSAAQRVKEHLHSEDAASKRKLFWHLHAERAASSSASCRGTDSHSSALT